MKMIFLKAFKQMFLKERIDRTVIIILVKINYSSKAFSPFGCWADTSYSKIRNMYKNTLASKYSIILLTPSCTPVLELYLLVISRGKFVFSYLLDCLKIERTNFVTTTDNAETREKTKKNERKSCGETVGVVAFWPDTTQYVR